MSPLRKLGLAAIGIGAVVSVALVLYVGRLLRVLLSEARESGEQRGDPYGVGR